jgi:DNA-binding MarR family transcriptional regulator
MFPFFYLRDKGIDWNLLRAIETSLSISEIADETKLSISKVSKIMNKIKNSSLGIRVGFESYLERAGLLYVATISRKHLERAPPYMQAERVLRVLGSRLFLYSGLMPAEDSAIEEWSSNFEDSAFTVRGLERYWWKTSAPATTYNDGWVCGDVEAIRVLETNQASYPSKELNLDDVDVLLLWAKFRWPFASLREAERESEKYLGRRVSHQVLSWHFRNHVLKLWAGNRVWLYADAQQVPYRLLYLEGRDAPAVARALVQLPWFHTAYIDVGKAVVSGQPPCASMPHLYRVLGDLDVDVLEFAMEVSISKWVPIFGLLSQIVKRKEVVSG